MKRVLVTGGSGFIAGHCILQLLERGYFVRTTVRSAENEASVRTILENAGMIQRDKLGFVVADLMNDEGWSEATEGTDLLLHIASPVQPGHVASEDDLIRPAREGTLRVLRAARDAGVKRTVVTSAFHAVSWGHPHSNRTFTENDWTNIDGPGVDAYAKSKTLAERAAWNFMAKEPGSMELTTMLPVAVVGPIMGRNITGSNHLIQRMLNGKMPALPNLFIPIVDVRDVASAHILAATNAHAAAQRFLLSSGPPMHMKEIASVLRSALGKRAKHVPSRPMPDVLLRTAALWNAELRPFVRDLGYAKKTSSEKACSVLDWAPRDPRDAIIAAAESMQSEVGSLD